MMEQKGVKASLEGGKIRVADTAAVDAGDSEDNSLGGMVVGMVLQVDMEAAGTGDPTSTDPGVAGKLVEEALLVV